MQVRRGVTQQCLEQTSRRSIDADLVLVVDDVHELGVDDQHEVGLEPIFERVREGAGERFGRDAIFGGNPTGYHGVDEIRDYALESGG